MSRTSGAQKRQAARGERGKHVRRAVATLSPNRMAVLLKYRMSCHATRCGRAALQQRHRGIATQSRAQNARARSITCAKERVKVMSSRHVSHDLSAFCHGARRRRVGA
jgi:hypothetical protein